MGITKQQKVDYQLKGIDIVTAVGATERIVNNISKYRPVSEQEQKDLKELVLRNMLNNAGDNL